MKFTTRLFFFWVSIFFLFFMATVMLMQLFFGLNLTFWQAAVVFTVAGVIPPAVITAFYYKRLDYMESDDIEPPVFSGSKRAVFPFVARSKRNHFDELMQRVDKQWIMSYSDRENKVLKFRTDTRMMAWGIGGYVKMENDTQVSVVVYPINSKSSRDARVMIQTLRIMRAILRP